MAAEAGGDPKPIVESVDDRLAVRRHVVAAGRLDRQRDVAQDGQQTVELGSQARFRRAAQVAREHASVGELLRGDAAVDCDHERLQQALADRLAEEERARLVDDRQVEAERLEQHA